MRFARISTRLIAVLLTHLAFALGASAFEIEDRRQYPAEDGARELRIISTADAPVFEPIIRAFQLAHPDVAIDYVIASSTELMKAISEEEADFDLAISSAMDLQTKLANDGFALDYRSEATDALPKWAKWHDQIFAFTQEPAVMVIAEGAFANRPAPRTRDDLIAMLRDNPAEFDGRIGTYDVRISGAGYLFATQDSRNTDSYWRLTEVMGRLNAQLYSGSKAMIEDVAAGRLALAYNVVGSYAAQRLADTPGIRIVPFEDFLSVMLRTALIPKNAQNIEDAGLMIDFLVQLNQREDIEQETYLAPVSAQSLNENYAARPIRLGPGLLVFLDRLKKETFLRNWENAIVQK
ncbi:MULTISPECIES: ABC transporter substrate-binding protein [Halocynthiibacter]|uniref:Extracellular solute-binding protein n=1 Tax=Halocynthiibacter halioticoli TaxID=2986804 RepID=A0AAE3LQP2_9RHOB|nr:MULTISPECIES: extracellular solute-binding protein [Halocynthiibacter]MCV6823753.1 extracellular solute-binding protein [Halocynthiibacter halioticoli]MCW4056754.1 extracellular solute-binding protein [Halocynthiibacter sp. SDUM655004]